MTTNTLNMKNVSLLTKADILQGKEKRETFYIEKLDRKVVIRPLTDGEITTIFKEAGNVKIRDDGFLNFSELDISTNMRLLRVLASRALIDPKLNEEELAELPFGIPGLIAKRVLEISGVTPESSVVVEKFRDNP